MIQPSFVVRPTYDHIHQATLSLVQHIKTLGHVDAIVAPARGGLLMGVIASHALNVPLVPVSYSSKKGKGDDRNHDNVLPPMSKYKRILVVDDIADSGETLKEINDHYKSEGIDVLTAVIHLKESSVFTPTVYFLKIAANSEFIVYPYERT